MEPPTHNLKSIPQTHFNLRLAHRLPLHTFAPLNDPSLSTLACLAEHHARIVPCLGFHGKLLSSTKLVQLIYAPSYDTCALFRLHHAFRPTLTHAERARPHPYHHMRRFLRAGVTHTSRWKHREATRASVRDSPGRVQQAEFASSVSKLETEYLGRCFRPWNRLQVSCYVGVYFAGLRCAARARLLAGSPSLSSNE